MSHSTLANAGTTISNERTLCRWRSYFLVNKQFPHPNVYIELGKEFQPKLFEYFPEAWDKLKNWMNNNLEILSTEWAIEDALLLEEEKLLMKDIWAFQFQQDGKTFREYHVDCHPLFLERYVIDEKKQFCGNLSCHFPEGSLPTIIIGNDKCVFKENTFSAKAWHGSEGQSVLHPKDDGHGLMISAYVSQAWAFNVVHLLTEEKLIEINQRQQQPQFRHYLSANAATEVTEQQ